MIDRERVAADIMKKIRPYLSSLDTGQFVRGLIEDELARHCHEGFFRSKVSVALGVVLLGILIGVAIIQSPLLCSLITPLETCLTLPAVVSLSSWK